jgi:hypothetical protein
VQFESDPFYLIPTGTGFCGQAKGYKPVQVSQHRDGFTACRAAGEITNSAGFYPVEVRLVGERQAYSNLNRVGWVGEGGAPKL